jgi:hypothetical protein
MVESMLGLEEASDVLVGDAFHKGISGGQMRRLTIGVEIVNLPDLLCEWCVLCVLHAECIALLHVQTSEVGFRVWACD